MVSVGKWRLRWWYERPDASETKGLVGVNLERPRQWLGFARGEFQFLPALRRLLAEHGRSDIWQLTDDVVVDLAAQQLSARRITVLQYEPPERTGTSPDPVAEVVKPFPKEKREPKRPTHAPPTPEEAVFPKDVQLVAVAKVLQDASKQGTPFCEECAKAAALAAAKNQST